MKLKIDHPKILEKIAKSFAGDEGPFPYRSGPALVSFFTRFGYNDKYGQGFPTRWRYAEDRISDLIRRNCFEQFIQEAASIEELINVGVDISAVETLQKEIITYLNQNVINLTERETRLINGQVLLVKKEGEKLLGSGHIADVYPVNRGGKTCAVKKLKREYWSDQEVVHRFKREYEIMNNLNGSDFTINVWEYSDTEKLFYMDIADATLKDFIDNNYNIMNDAWKEHLCERVIFSLKELHKTTLHRDLSYNNILVIKNEPKLADFGLGKDNTSGYSYKTVTEQGVGTAHFTDPIQLRNFKDANTHTDIYSLGKIIDFIFNGSIVSEEHKYSAIVTRATHRDVSKRYRTVAELYEAFQAVKSSKYDYDPLAELLEMSKEDNVSSEKVYKVFIRRDAGNILFQLILSHYTDAVKLADIFSIQYEHEFEMLMNSLDEGVCKILCVNSQTY